MTTVAERKAEHPAVRIDKEIDRALTSAAKDFKTTRAQIIKSALVEYLQDMADSKAIAEARKKGGKMITHAELKKQLGLKVKYAEPAWKAISKLDKLFSLMHRAQWK